MTIDVDVILRDDITQGDSGSGAHKPVKSQLRQYLKALGRAAASNTVHVATKTELDAITGTTDDQGGMVWGDSTAANNGVYRWDANAGPAAWEKIAGLPHTAAVLTNIGGTANAITADTETGVDPAEVKILVLPDPPGTNTSTTVTLALNGGSAESIKAASGSNLAIGDIIDGVGTLFFRSGSEWRQLVSSRGHDTLDYQGAWDSGTPYTQGQFVTRGTLFAYLNAPSSTGEDPASGAPWVTVFDFANLASNYATVAALTAVSKAGLSNGYVATVTADYQGGTFRWDASSTETADGGTIFASDEGGNGRWVRLARYGNQWRLGWFGANFDGTDDYAALEAAVAALPVGARLVIESDATFDNSADDVKVTTARVSIVGLGNPTMTFQDYRKSGLQVRADGVRIANLKIVNTDTPVDMKDDPSYENLPARGRSAGIFIYGASYLTVENCEIENFSCGTNFSNVRDAGSAAFKGNTVLNLTTRSCDQGILFGQQDDFFVDNHRNYDTTQVQTGGSGNIEPHAVYGTNTVDLATGLVKLVNGDVNFQNLYSDINEHDSHFKFKSCQYVLVNGAVAKTAQIFFQFEECLGGLVSNFIGYDLYNAGANTQQGVHVLQSPKVKVSNSKLFVRDGVEQVIGYRANESDDVVFEECEFYCNRDDTSGGAPFAVESSDRVRIDNCKMDDAGNNNEAMFYVVDSNDTRIKHPTLIGSNRIVSLAGSTDGLNLAVDPDLCHAGIASNFFTDASSGTNHYSFDYQRSGTITDFTITPATLGDWSPTYTTRTCTWQRNGMMVYVNVVLVFDAGTFTTAAGAFTIEDVLPFEPAADTALIPGRYNFTDLNALIVDFGLEARNGLKDVLPFGNRDGAVPTGLGVGAGQTIESGETGIVIEFSGWYLTDELPA